MEEVGIEELIKQGKFSDARDYFKFAEISSSRAQAIEDDSIKMVRIKETINHICMSFGLIYLYLSKENLNKINEDFSKLEKDLRKINPSLADKFYEEWTNSSEKYNAPF